MKSPPVNNLLTLTLVSFTHRRY